MSDVALVSLGATAGLRAADEELAASMRRAGASVSVVAVPRPREVRTFALTDLAWALAARRAAAGAGRTAAGEELAAAAGAGRTAAGEELANARVLIYSSVTAALLWPRVGAVRFDSLAAANRPGRHGVWQRPLEKRRLREASLLVPWSSEALAGAPALRAEAVVVPVPVAPSGPLDGPRGIAAITYAAHWQKKGLDRVLRAWHAVARPGEELVVAGLDEAPAGVGTFGSAYRNQSSPPPVRFVGSLPRDEYRALLRRSRVFVTAPRREDHGIAQLEALADGCALVTTEAPGPYVALAIARGVDPRLVVGRGGGSGKPGRAGNGGTEEDRLVSGIGRAIRLALDDPRADYAERAAAALAPLAPAAVDATVANELLPRLLTR